MALNLSIGGAIASFDADRGRELAGVLDRAFGLTDDWQGAQPRGFGKLSAETWSGFLGKAAEALGSEEAVNLLAITEDGRGVFLPAHVQTVSLPMATGTLRCASLPGLRRELDELAALWMLPESEVELEGLVEAGMELSGRVERPEILMLARLMLAANEAVRRDCPLWLVGDE